MSFLNLISTMTAIMKTLCLSMTLVSICFASSLSTTRPSEAEVTTSLTITSSHRHWVYQFLHNLFAYLMVMFPGVIIVYAVKSKSCPPRIANLSWIRIFVFGKELVSQQDVEEPSDSSSDEETDNKRNKTNGTVVGLESQSSTLLSSKRCWHMRDVITLLYCFLGLQVSFLVWGLLQEKIMTTEYKSSPLQPTSVNGHEEQEESKRIRFHDSQFLVLVNRILAFFTASVALMIQRYHGRKRVNDRRYKRMSSRSTSSTIFLIPPLHKFSLCSVSNILSSWCQYEALKYVNFPTQILSKACKLLPVMIMSQILSKKRYHRLEYLIAITVSLGMCLFLMGSDQESHLNKTSKESSNSYSLIDGLIILGLYLTFDSFTSNWQEKLSHQYQASSLQMMTFVNLFSILLTLTSLAQQSHLIPSLRLVMSSFELSRDCFLLSVCSACGQLFIFYTISHFGAFTFTFIMTLRQTFAIILSCLIYGHSLTFLAVFGVFVVFGGSFAQIYLKSRNRRGPKG